LASDAKAAFVGGMRSAVIVSAISLGLAAAYTWWRAPSRSVALEDVVEIIEPDSFVTIGAAD
jgi:hypothetical protein